MKIYVIKESDYDYTRNHGIYYNKEKAIKKLKDLFNEQKRYYGKQNSYHPEWINEESFGIFCCDTYKVSTFEIIE
jgi:hypothetical protein